MNNKEENQIPLWEVFIQSRNGQPYKHAGNLHAADKEMALHNARDVYTRRNEGTSIWVVPSNFIAASNPDDNEMFFDPANDKAFRNPTFYDTPKGAKI